MTISINRQLGTPSKDTLRTLILQMMRAAMPRVGGQAFSDEALVTGEIGRILRMLTEMLLEVAWESKKLGRQLTLSNVQDEYLELMRTSYGFPPKESYETTDEYLTRVVNRMMVQGVTMPNIQAHLNLLGFEAELRPMAGKLLVPSKKGRSLSTRHGLFLNRVTKAGVYEVEVWSPWWTTRGIRQLLDELTSAGYAWNWKHHIHWNGVNDVVVSPPQLPGAFQLTKVINLTVSNLDAFTPGTRRGALSRKATPLGGKRQSFGLQISRVFDEVVPEGGILAYLPIDLDGPNRYVEIDWNLTTSSNVVYNVVSAPLQIDSQVSSLQAGVEITFA